MAFAASPKRNVWDSTLELMMRALLSVVAGLALLAPSAHANEELMRRGGCVGCHDVDEKLIGPAYRDVAKHYRGRPEAFEQLFKKVRDGGKGHWGDASMPPNDKDKISDDDLRRLLQWILSL